jgi:hypothetical protein
LLQTFPQPPQLVLLVDVFTHAPEHNMSPDVLHLHAPLWQELPAPHTFPQFPQLVLSLPRFVHTPLHIAIVQTLVHAPFMQPWPEGHAWPQLPQCAAVDVRSTHPAPPGQSVCPETAHTH